MGTLLIDNVNARSPGIVQRPPSEAMCTHVIMKSCSHKRGGSARRAY